MSEEIDLMGAGVRVGAAQAVIADFDDVVVLGVSDEIGRAVLSMPPHAARHLAERLVLKAAEVERGATHPPAAEPLVPRRTGLPNTESPWG